MESFMKKSVVVYLIVLVVVVALISLFAFSSGSKNEVKEEKDISKIVEDSNLEILLNLENFASNMYSEEKLLQVAMMYAEKNGYMNENSEEGYMEYVNRGELHAIMKELTNIQVEAPIQIEDFYFVYDSESDYYYCIPVDYSVYQISKINHVYKTADGYTIECVATKTQDGEITSEKTFTTKLKMLEDGSYVNYQVVKQEMK